MGVFDKRVAFKPFEYPELVQYKEAVQHSYWLVSEWNFISDVHDFNARLTEVERCAIKNALLAISQIEVSVKRFWTKIGDRFPKPEIEQVGVVYGECFVDGTEILTPKGWVDLKEVKVGDAVIQYNPDSTLNVTKVLHKTDQPYEGDLIRFHKRSTETVVTPNHRMLYFTGRGEYREQEAKEFSVKTIKNSRYYLPEAARLVGGDVKFLAPLDRLRIAIQADGNRRYYNSGYGKKLRKGNGKGAEYEVRIQKPRKIERMDWLLEQLPEVNYSKRAIPSRPGMFCYTIQIDADFDYKTFQWVDLQDKTSSWCEEFIQEVAEWDGTRLPTKKDCKIKYSSTNKEAADIVQAVGVAAGYRTNMGVHVDERSETFNPVYVVSFTVNREKTPLPPLKSETVPYSGFVRCVTVDSGAVVTRLNGKTFISGNSEVRHADAYSHLLQILSLNGDFDQLLENPVIQGRVDYLSKYLKNASDNNSQNYVLTLTLFSIFIENVSLFSQFLVIKSLYKYRNLLKDIDNVVMATAKEEQVHALFGVRLIEIVKQENPDWFNEDFYGKLTRACKKAFEAERKIIDWIFESGELPYLPKSTVVEFLKHRFNDSMRLIGGDPPFEVDATVVKSLQWFESDVYQNNNSDFFHQRPVSYSKKVKAVKAEDLF